MKIEKAAFKQNLKTLFLNKPVYIFLIGFLFVNVILFLQHTEALKSFALLEKSFTLADAKEHHAIELLSNKFTCETKIIIPGCYNYIYALFVLFIFLEAFVIYNFIKNRRIIQKKILIGYSLLLQLLLIIPLLVITYAPYRAFDILGQQANKEIADSIQILISKENLNKLKIEDNLNVIAEKMDSGEKLPPLLEDDPKEQAILQILGIKQNKKDSLYKVSVIPYQAYYAPEISKEKEKIKFEALLFPDNTLIVGSVNRNILEELIPVLSDKIVRLKFNKYVMNIRVVPKVDVPSEKEYIAIRKMENEKIKNELLAYIQEIKDNIAYNESALSNNQLDIIEINREYDRYKAYGEGWLVDCRRELGAGHKDCIDGEKKFNSELQVLVADRQISEENIKNIRFYISEGQGYLVTAQKNYKDFTENPISAELEEGVFIFPNTIHLKYKPSNVHRFSRYLATAIHEYLHFYSFSTAPRMDLPRFLNEGITDYLTSTSIEDFLKYETEYSYVAYLNEVGIVEKLVLLITEDELKDIYFNQNENALKRAIDDILSEGIYDVVREKGNLLVTGGEDKETQERLKKQIYELLSKKVDKK